MKNKILFLLTITCLGLIGIAATSNVSLIYQPPAHDASIGGVGNDEVPLTIPHGVVYAVTETQATTAAPTVLEMSNLLGNEDDVTVTRDSIGHYKYNFHQAVLTDSTFTFSATTGNAAGFVNKWFRLNDSIAMHYVFSKTGIGADAVGKTYLEIKGPVPEDD